MDPKIIQEVNETLSKGFELPIEKIKPEAQLFTELGLDSLDAVDMVVQLEERFKVKVTGEKIREVRSVQDVYNLVAELAAKQSTSHPEALTNSNLA